MAETSARRDVIVPVEWARQSREPRGDTDERTLRSSGGALTGAGLLKLLERCQAGTPRELPQVIIGRVGSAERTRIVMAFQERSNVPDWLGRPSIDTHIFCVPYDQVALGPVGYEGLYRALRGLGPAEGGPRDVRLPVLRPADLAGHVTERARFTAALLTTGTRVCLIGAEPAALAERLRFLDTVAALLPFGMRTRFSAATWAGSTADHGIRLSFSDGPRGDAHNLHCDRELAEAELPEGAAAYLELLRQAAEPETVVARLAAAVEPLSFDDPALVLEAAQSALRGDAAARQRVSAEVDALLTETADALDHGQGGLLELLVERLEAVPATELDMGRRARHQRTIAERRMLSPRPALPDEIAVRLYQAVLRPAYGPALTLATARDILGTQWSPSTSLTEALLRMPHDDPRVVLEIGRHGAPGGTARVLDKASPEDLVGWACFTPPDRELVELVCEELARRGGSGGDAEVAGALHECGYLAPVLAQVFRHRHADQVSRLTRLLTAAYGGEIDEVARDRILDLPRSAEHPALRAAVRLCTAPPGERPWSEPEPPGASGRPADEDEASAGPPIALVRLLLIALPVVAGGLLLWMLWK
ncbi:hypothetical protein ETD83_05630 [Actinomadura soli]|uniref:Uncharacterized protein n=1 Tax=Actinomadura soli TaxID=2508997 RepID=A0A5C4JIM8_9ACTN|nr:hypothetical protein [Actinomadura soli]TMR05719.1 hypothetical protein ETD83_05630 [Actinomadura soli]